MLKKIFSRGVAVSSTGFQTAGSAVVSISSGALVSASTPISRRVSTRNNCSPEELAEISAICELLGAGVDSKLKPISLIWQVACGDDEKYKDNFIGFLKDFRKNLGAFIDDAKSENDVKTSLAAKISIPPLSIKRVYILCFKTNDLRGRPEDGRRTADELIQQSELPHNNLDALMNSVHSR